MSSNAKRLWVINLLPIQFCTISLLTGGIQEMNLLPVFQIQLNRIRVVLILRRRNIQWKTRKITRLDGLD
jgi:hypothetical protein